ncbi:FAD binding domain-containing protein [Zopfia rhizophila CBS 207.26]|uniref:FAD binding domain-containing protein n=1 Tax=Zopfia rhizophila CBS 207.26 TaxID=1314779 RepID=A0A6A6DHP0_9PEZI|nr:FAD binding domain-containing protein [Zopfia rhizophila CBS 207.26]
MKAFPFLASAIVSISSAKAGDRGTADVCCNALNRDHLLKDKVYFPGTPAYEARLNTYFDANAALRSWCMVLPGSTEDASHVMHTLSKHKCPFGIKSGGHGTFKLSNAVKDGVTIDLGFMNATTYHPERGVVAIQPAAKSAPAYEALEEYGVVVTGGRVGPVGLGGFVSGGGISFHAGAHGWACDNVENFEVVLANGDIVNANEHEHSDLWLAMRGGSGNFGLITRFDMKAIKFADPSEPNIFGGLVGYDLSKGQEVVDAYINFAENIQKDPYSSVVFWWYYNREAGEMVLVACLDNSANQIKPPAMDKFLSIDGIISSTLRSATMGNITRELAGDDGYYNIWFPSTFKNDPRVILYAQEKHKELIRALEGVVSTGEFLSTQCQFQPITKTMVDHSNNNNVMGLERHVADGPGILFLMYVTVGTAADEAVALPLVRAYHEDLNRYASSLGINWNWIYLDYANLEQDPISTFGEENIGKMKKASAKYDPDGVFQKLRGSGFKIPA